MSFWAGLASGMKDGLAQQERQEERDANQNWQERMFEYRQKQDTYAKSRQERLDVERLEERDYNRKRQDEEMKLARVQTFLPYLNNPAMAGALAGQGDSSSLAPMSPKAIAAGSTAFQTHLGDLTPEQRQSPFFDALSQSPDGQAAVVAFMSAQAKEGNTIGMQDLPKYFRYMGSVEGQGQEAATGFLKSMLEGSADINNTDTFIKGLFAMSQWKPTKHLFQHIDSPTDTSDLKPQYEAWKTGVINEAMNEASIDPESERSKDILDAVTDTQNGDTETRGLNSLVSEYGFGVDLVKQQGFDDNFLISSFYETPTPSKETPHDIVVPDPETGQDPVAGELKTWEDVEAARQNGFSGMVTIDGVSYNITPLEGQAPENKKTPAPNKEQGFMEFGDSATENVDTTVKEINSLSFEGDTQVVVDGVKQKLLDAGIKWPTNEQEMNHFIQDLNEAIEGFGLNVPDNILNALVDEAASNSLDQTAPATANETRANTEKHLRSQLEKAEKDYRLDWSRGRRGNPERQQQIEQAKQALDEFLSSVN